MYVKNGDVIQELKWEQTVQDMMILVIVWQDWRADGESFHLFIHNEYHLLSLRKL